VALLVNAPHDRTMSLKELRAQRAWSQEDLALEAGVARDTVKQIENGKGRSQEKTLRKLAAALGIELAELAEHLGGDTPRPGE